MALADVDQGASPSASSRLASSGVISSILLRAASLRCYGRASTSKLPIPIRITSKKYSTPPGTGVPRAATPRRRPDVPSRKCLRRATAPGASGGAGAPAPRSAGGSRKARDPAAAERLHDVERLGRLVDLHRHRLRARLEAQRAPASASGLPQIRAPVASAENSRWREIASWMSVAEIGARITIASEATSPSGESSSSPNQSSSSAIQVIAAPIAAATDWREDVAVADVRELVRDHAAELVLGEQLE